MITPKQNKEDWDEFENYIKRNPQTWLIIGKQGSGKTHTGFSLMKEFPKTKQKFYVVNFPKPKLLPRWIKNITLDEFIEGERFDGRKFEYKTLHGGFVLIEVDNIPEISSYFRNDAYARCMNLARQNSMDLACVVQNSARITINALRSANTLILKEPSTFQAHFERKEIGRIYKEIVGNIWGDIKKKLRCKFGYIYSDDYQGLCEFSKVDEFTDEISTAWGNKV